jgi:ABC-type uncharacterized transport system auxiliary subunit
MMLLSLIFLAGCFTIKSDYPKIEFYRLEQIPSTLSAVPHEKGRLEVRTFTSAEDIDNVHLLALWNDGRLQRYFYFRWITDCSSLVTDFFINRINLLNIFSEGAGGSGSISQPDYILEGRVLDMVAHNNNNSDSNDVYIAVRISLYANVTAESVNTPILSRLYTISESRKDNFAASIVPAFSKGMSMLADSVIRDIDSYIKK